MPVTTALEVAPRPAAPAGARLVVARQHPESGLIEPVGLLTCHASGYRFDHLARATGDGFEAFLGAAVLARQGGDRATVPADWLLVRRLGWTEAGRQPFDGPDWRKASA